MIRAYWNALRIDDVVVVHDDDDPAFAVSAGTVTTVDARQGPNDLTIRLSGVGGSERFVSPKRLAVHLDVGDTNDDCWRCDVLAAAPH